MKPLLLNTSDIVGGAARAAYRIHQGLQDIGVASKMLVHDKRCNDTSIIGTEGRAEKITKKLALTLDTFPLHWYRSKKPGIFSPAYVPGYPAGKINKYNPDIIHLHWTCNGFLRVETIAKFHKPIIWTFHDMWAFTGGCHYDEGCGRYTKKCGKCPHLNSLKDRDLSRWIWKRKHKAWQRLNLTIVTPSKWLAQCARSSSLFSNVRVEVIPNGLDTDRFKPINKTLARNILSLPQNKKLILFGALSSTSDRRKGFQLLHPALQKLATNGWSSKTELVILGPSESSALVEPGLKTHYLGRLHDDISLTILYSAVDVFVLPSIQENLPNMIIEAMSCGTPCVAFDIGGIPDIIEHKKTGYLARSFETDDLAEGIAWTVGDNQRWQTLSHQARKKVEQEFELRLVAKQYLKLFNDVTGITSTS